jgi:hypothetical protein
MIRVVGTNCHSNLIEPLWWRSDIVNHVSRTADLKVLQSSSDQVLFQFNGLTDIPSENCKRRAPVINSVQLQHCVTAQPTSLGASAPVKLLKRLSSPSFKYIDMSSSSAKQWLICLKRFSGTRVEAFLSGVLSLHPAKEDLFTDPPPHRGLTPQGASRQFSPYQWVTGSGVL